MSILTNDKAPNRLYGYTVAHIFGGADNPLLFSAGFNLALILDGFVKFNEQHLNPQIYWALTSSTYLLNRNLLENPQNLYEMFEIPFEDKILSPLFPKIVNNKIKKDKFKIKFQKVDPFPFWFDVKVIKKCVGNYEITKIRPKI